jgi:predicted PurR-regulated permease PerM
MAAFVAMAAFFLWHAIQALSSLLLMLVCALFIALAIEPPVMWLIKKGWRRSLATLTVELGTIAVIIGLIAAFGQMFLNQLISLVTSLPKVYDQAATWLENRFDLDIPSQASALTSLTSSWGANLAGRALSAGSALYSGFISMLGVALIVYYVVAQGPQLRAAICSPLTAHRQRHILRLWSIAEDKVAGYISSRVLLATISAVVTAAFLMVLKIPYALPLAVFTGLISQFVPTIGTYLGGAAPILFALLESPPKALAVLIFIVAYQQVENFLLAPRISSRAMEINPAVAFVSVIGVGALMGPIGAFLALPLVATAQAVISTYVRRYTLIDNDLLRQDE